MTLRAQSFHQHHIANGRTSNSTALTLTVPAAGARVGTLLVAAACGKAVASIVDTGSNTWTLVQADTTQNIKEQWYCLVTTALVSGNTITITFSAKTDASGGVEAFWGVQKVSDGVAKNSHATALEMTVTSPQLPSRAQLIYATHSYDETRVLSNESTGTGGQDGWTQLTVFGATTGELTRPWVKFAHPHSIHTHSVTQSVGATWNALIAAFPCVSALSPLLLSVV